MDASFTRNRRYGKVYGVVRRGYISDAQADAILFYATGLLLLNFVNQAAAFPFQVAIMIYVIWKCDLKLLPALIVSTLDKFAFPIFGRGGYFRLSLGFGFTLYTTCGLIFFVCVMIWLLRGKYRGKLTFVIFLWLTAVVPAFVISFQARHDGVTFWQAPLGEFLAPAIYFWAVLAGRTWTYARDYLCKRLVVIFLLFNLGSLLRVFYVFTFAENVVSICLFIAFMRYPVSSLYKGIAFVGAALGIVNVLFSRYISMVTETGYADSSDVGSTFTSVMVVVFGIGFALTFGKLIKRGTMRLVPWVTLVFCACVFCYAVGRARSKTGKILQGVDIRSIYDRFDYKLVSDRGQLWSNSLEDVFKPPLVFRKMQDRVSMVRGVDGVVKEGMMCLPHNQILTLLIVDGFWLGGVLILFLWFSHVNMFKSGEELVRDKLCMSLLMPASAAIFIAVGLTGQSLTDLSVKGNAIAVLIFSGVVYGARISAREERVNARFVA